MSPADREALGRRLIRMGLPHMGGMNVLLVGPGSGPLAAFAAHQRASRVDAIPCIDAAEPGTCTYDVIAWLDGAPECILQDGRLAQVMSRLTRSGLLVLENTLGAVDAIASVHGGDSHRHVVSQEHLETALADYAVKLVSAPCEHPVLGPAATLVVHHVAIRRPVVCLMMAPPGWGKSSLARQIFASHAASLPVIGADSLIHRIALGQIDVAQGLCDAIREGFSPLCIDQAVHRIMDRGQIGTWVDVVVEAAGGADFVLEGFVPARYHPDLQDAFRDRGYLPVRMEWDREHPAPMDAGRIRGELLRFDRAAREGRDTGPLASVPAGTVAGNVDAMIPGPRGVTLRGWAVTATGHRPERFEVRQGRELLEILEVHVEDRPDVRDHLDLPHGRIGFRLLVQVQGGVRGPRRTAAVSVRVADARGEWHGPLHRSG